MTGGGGGGADGSGGGVGGAQKPHAWVQWSRNRHASHRFSAGGSVAFAGSVSGWKHGSVEEQLLFAQAKPLANGSHAPGWINKQKLESKRVAALTHDNAGKPHAANASRLLSFA